MKRIVFALLFVAVSITSCDKEDEGCTATASTANFSDEQLAQLTLDIGYIDEYLDQNGITAIEHESGLRYVIHTQGSGLKPELCSTVRVNYTGRVLNRTSIFDANDEIAFELSNLILGWRIGFTQLEAGTSATLYIPSGLGYGTSGRGSTIPGNANLIFDVELLEIL